jgi:hypothetical protein
VKRPLGARLFRVGNLSPGASRLPWGLLGAGLLGAGLLAGPSGCAANCLRDSDCDDAHVCRHDRCELPGSSAPDARVGEAGEAGASGSSPSTAQGGAGGSATLPDTSSGGSATGGREILDASPD